MQQRSRAAIRGCVLTWEQPGESERLVELPGYGQVSSASESSERGKFFSSLVVSPSPQFRCFEWPSSLHRRKHSKRWNDKRTVRNSGCSNKALDRHHVQCRHQWTLRFPSLAGNLKDHQRVRSGRKQSPVYYLIDINLLFD